MEEWEKLRDIKEKEVEEHGWGQIDVKTSADGKEKVIIVTMSYRFRYINGKWIEIKKKS